MSKETTDTPEGVNVSRPEPKPTPNVDPETPKSSISTPEKGVENAAESNLRTPERVVVTKFESKALKPTPNDDTETTQLEKESETPNKEESDKSKLSKSRIKRAGKVTAIVTEGGLKAGYHVGVGVGRG